MELLDAHCHIDLMQDPAAVARRTEQAGIVAISVTNAPSVFMHTSDLCKSMPHLRGALGLHPELVASHHSELPLFKELLPLTAFIGEVGLDFVSNDKSLRSLQRKVFQTILDACALAGDKVLTVHSRRAATAVLDDIGGNFPGIIILHWFSGTPRELARAIDVGCLFSINLPMLQSKNGRALIQKMPRDRVLTETDGPFATIRGQPAEPNDIRSTVRSLSHFWQCSEEIARDNVTANFAKAMKCAVKKPIADSFGVTV